MEQMTHWLRATQTGTPRKGKRKTFVTDRVCSTLRFIGYWAARIGQLTGGFYCIYLMHCAQTLFKFGEFNEGTAVCVEAAIFFVYCIFLELLIRAKELNSTYEI